MLRCSVVLQSTDTFIFWKHFFSYKTTHVAASKKKNSNYIIILSDVILAANDKNCYAFTGNEIVNSDTATKLKYIKFILSFKKKMYF